MSTVAVTGSTGRVGGRVARQLAAAGVRQRLIVRDSTRAPVLPHAGVAVAEYRDKAASVAALEGVEMLFMVSAQENPERVTEHRTFIDAAAAAGVANVLYLSFFGARPDATFLLLEITGQRSSICAPVEWPSLSSGTIFTRIPSHDMSSMMSCVAQPEMGGRRWLRLPTLRMR